MGFAGFGPTLLDLVKLYDTSVETISVIFTVNGFGALVGPPIGNKKF